VLDGEEYWSAESKATAGRARSSVCVLPAFDELLVGYAYGGTLVDAAVTKRVRAGGMIHPVVVVDGHVAGTWGRRLSAREVTCKVTAFEALNAVAMNGLERALERYARFLGRTLRLEKIPRPGRQ
jgi:hypothetical protein